MGDEPKPVADDPTAESALGGPPAVSPPASTSDIPPTEPASPSIRVEGLAETLHEVRHELNLLSTAHRYSWTCQLRLREYAARSAGKLPGLRVRSE